MPEPESTIKLSLDDHSIPRLPPPLASSPRIHHSRSRTTIDIPPLLPERSPRLSTSPSPSSTFIPFISASRSPSPKRRTPIPNDGNEDFLEDPAEPRKSRSGKVERLTSWFEGSSEPVNTGLGLVASPKKDKEEGGVMNTMAVRSQESVQRPIMSSANSSRFSFFKKTTTSSTAQSPDGLENLSIKDTLFPHGPADEFSPAAFKNLQQNAEGALKTFQQAYRDLQIALRRAVSERNAQADDLEASQTRNEHLKSQLLDMADRAAEQEKRIADLTVENEQLKANEANLRSIRVITDHTSADSSDIPNVRKPMRRNRSSDVSYTESIESASTDLSTMLSIFSQNENDATMSIHSPATSVGCPSPQLRHATPVMKHARVVTPHVQDNGHLRSLTGDVMVAVPDCQKCHGLKGHEAWEVLGVMKAESAALKQRIQELEAANETAFDLCTWRPQELLDINNKCNNVIGGQAGLRIMDDELMNAPDDPRMKGCIV